jgi:hypothetical protein
MFHIDGGCEVGRCLGASDGSDRVDPRWQCCSPQSECSFPDISSSIQQTHRGHSSSLALVPFCESLCESSYHSTCPIVQNKKLSHTLLSMFECICIPPHIVCKWYDSVLWANPVHGWPFTKITPCVSDLDGSELSDAMFAPGILLFWSGCYSSLHIGQYIFMILEVFYCTP